MNARPISRLCVFTKLAILAIGLGQVAAVAAQDRADPEEGVEVLTRGPVHEAFAETVTFDPEPGIVVTKPPPEAIDELPPEQRPEGSNVEWIPGYWAWDDEQDNYLWVSGVWRDVPPGRDWVPGYWGRTKAGFQWTSGYWADSDANDIEYLPEPPESVEVGPSTPPPSPDEGWVPGIWVWHDSHYAWRPGYWMVVHPNWDWIPAHYVWARRGYVFVDGYWDYALSRRGVLFAPVEFQTRVFARPGFSYSPTTVINLSVFSDHLFVRPHYSHYYFGDYYAPRYREEGFRTSFSLHTDHVGYDPIYARRRWDHRQDQEWAGHIEADFRHRRDHEDARPPRTLAAQLTLRQNAGQPGDRRPELATPFAQFAKKTDGGLRFQTVTGDERKALAQRGNDVQKFREARLKLENAAADTPAGKHPQEPGATRATLGRSPIAGKPAAELGQDRTPPKRPEVPKPDPKIEPKQRTTKGKR